MKRFLTLIIALMFFGAANAQVLYKISGKGIKKESYILGTCHVVSSSFVDSIPGAHKVLNKVSQVCGEVESHNIMNPDTLAYIQQLMMLPGDSTLRDAMTDEQYNNFCKSVNDNLGIDLTQPQFAGFMKLRPLFFTITITALSEQLKAINSGNAGQLAQKAQLMDLYFQNEARQKGKPCIGLETTKFQMEILLKATESQFTMKEQIDNIIESTSMIDSAKNEVHKLVDAYKSMDIKKMEDYFAENLKNSKDAESLVFDIRNENWSKQIPTIMADKQTLFVVGMGHLVGEKSVLNLLKAQG
ncbi:MAG: TraB/GumN family protein, partial [Bacteroidales bacterium]|nr:TraB/GumN family protein [Bacteroidales bacterium]